MDESIFNSTLPEVRTFFTRAAALLRTPGKTEVSDGIVVLICNLYAQHKRGLDSAICYEHLDAPPANPEDAPPSESSAIEALTVFLHLLGFTVEEFDSAMSQTN